MERGLHPIEVVLGDGLEQLDRLVHVGGHLLELVARQGDAGVVGDAGDVFLAQGHAFLPAFLALRARRAIARPHLSSVLREHSRRRPTARAKAQPFGKL